MPASEPTESVARTRTPYYERSTVLASISVLICTAACVIVRLRFLAAKPFWFDECFSVEVARIGWAHFLRLLWWREANMSLYYVLLRLWMHLGQSPAFIRALSVVFAAATVPALYWLGKLLYDRRVGLAAAALFVFNAYSVRYSQEARSYTLFLLLATLSSCAFVEWLKTGSERSRKMYIAVSILAVYAHFYALLLVLVQWMAFQFGSSPSSPQVSKALRRAWIAIAIGVLPIIAFVAKTGAGPIKWIQRPTLRDLAEFYEHLAGGNSWAVVVACGIAIVVAIAPSVRGLRKREQTWDAWRCSFLLIWLIFPVAVTAALSFARPVFLARYMIFSLPALLVLTAAGIARLRAVTYVLALSALLLMNWQGMLFVYAHDFDNERDASVAAADFIRDHSQPGDAILFHIAETRIPYEFSRSLREHANTASPDFEGHLGPEILFPHHGPGLDYRDFTGKPTADFARTASASYPRLWIMLMNNGAPAHPDPTTLMLDEVLSQTFSQVARWQSAKVEVRLYSRKK